MCVCVFFFTRPVSSSKASIEGEGKKKGRKEKTETKRSKKVAIKYSKVTKQIEYLDHTHTHRISRIFLFFFFSSIALVSSVFYSKTFRKTKKNRREYVNQFDPGYILTCTHVRMQDEAGSTRYCTVLLVCNKGFLT